MNPGREWPFATNAGVGRLGLPPSSQELLDWCLDQQQEFETAREIHRRLMPKEMPRILGWEISAFYQPARAVGGDYFDVLQFTDRKIALCIADVVGKGIPAALLMANLQAAVKSFASEALAPNVLCEKVNHIVLNNTAEDKFITLFYCLIDTGRRSLVYTNAGHNPPILLRRDDSVLRLEEGGALLGVFQDWTYRQAEVELLSGDRLLLFTDGVTEVRSAHDHEFGEDRLVALLVVNRDLGAAQLQAKVMEAVVDFSGGALQDDATMVVLAVE